MKLPRLTLVTNDTKELTAQVRRLADVLELIAVHEFGLTIRPATAPKKGEEESDVIYATDQSTFIRELLDLDAKRDPLRTLSVDEDS